MNPHPLRYLGLRLIRVYLNRINFEIKHFVGFLKNLIQLTRNYFLFIKVQVIYKYRTV